MTREDAMLKLLALEPASMDELVRVTGWGVYATREVVAGLVRERRVTSSIHWSTRVYRIAGTQTTRYTKPAYVARAWAHHEPTRRCA